MLRIIVLMALSINWCYAQSLDISNLPLGLQNTIPPNLILLMDSSGSMGTRDVPQCRIEEVETGGNASCTRRCNYLTSGNNCPYNSWSHGNYSIDEDDFVKVSKKSNGWVGYQWEYSYYYGWRRRLYKFCDILPGDTEEVEVCDNITRQQAAINVAQDLTDDFDGFYVSIMNFNYSSGAKLINPPLLMDSDDATQYAQNVTTLKNKIGNTPADSWTPLGESISGVGTYFSYAVPTNLWVSQSTNGGKAAPSSQTASNVFSTSLLSFNNYSAPSYNALGGDEEIRNENMGVKGWCQKNYLITLTDGAPSKDQGVSNNIKSYENQNFTCYDNGSSGKTETCIFNHVSGALWDIDLRPDLCDPRLLDEMNEKYNVTLNKCEDLFTTTPIGGSKTIYQLLEEETALTGDDTNVGNDFLLHRYKSNIRHFLIGFAGDDVTASSLMEQTAALGGGEYYAAEDSKQLEDVFDSILNTIQGGQNSSSGVGISLTRGASADFIYRASYNTGDWSGRLEKIRLHRREGNIDLSAANVIWDTDADSIPIEFPLPSSSDASVKRNMFTYDPSTGKGITLEWNSLSSSHPIRTDLLAGGTNASLAKDRLEYLRGSQLNEFQNTGDEENGFRDRQYLLGDIVSSTPRYVPDGNTVINNGNNIWGTSLTSISLEDDPSVVFAGESYIEEYMDNNPRHDAIVYVNSNDGMLHAFDDETGEEIFAYMPSFVASDAPDQGLNILMDPNYEHTYLLDGSVEVEDAWLASANGGSGAWRTLLVSGANAGGKGIFLLDVTYESSSYFNQTIANAEELVLWEFTHPDMGYTYSEPYIGPMRNGRWAVVTNSGYNSDTGEAALFIIYLDPNLSDGWTEGDDYVVIKTGEGSSTAKNGMSPIVALDLYRDHDLLPEDHPDYSELPVYYIEQETIEIEIEDEDGEVATTSEVTTYGTIDRVYAGDLWGNVWAFDLFSTDPSEWKVDHGEEPFFKVDKDQGPGLYNNAITGAPTAMYLGRHIVNCDAPGVSENAADFGDSNVFAFSDHDFYPPGGFTIPRLDLTCGPNVLVMFGSGKLLSQDDVVSEDTGAFYSVWDNYNTDQFPLTSDDLSKRQFNVSGNAGSLVRSISQVGSSTNDFPLTGWDIEDEYGWYVDYTEKGERSISGPLVVAITGEVFFTTVIPDQLACSFGGTSFFNSLSAINGLQSVHARSATINVSVQLDGILGEPQIGGAESPGDPAYVLLGGNNVVGVKAVAASSRDAGPISWTELRSE